jgi:TRAP-type C4-dicarboxylate transport system permease large subunit
MSRDDLLHSLLDVAGMTGMIFLILFGAELVNVFLALAAFPEHLAGLVQGGGLNPHLVLALIIILYLVLGCVMDSLAMIFLTVPILWPIVAALDFGLPVADLQIWFGILVLMVVELGLMTPPVGLNVLIINAYAPDVSLRESFAGALPFVVAGLLQTALLVAFPAIALWLPHLLWQ